jgi:two-component system, NtrC family, nitrogen regulation sensor histidine kinase GlnL
VDLWREIIDSLGDAVFVVSPAHEPIAVNAAAETLLGASQVNHTVITRLLGRNEWLARMVESCLKSGQSLDNPETVLALGQREETVRAEVSPLLNSQGEPESAIVLLHDLSRERSAQQAFGADEAFLRLSPAGLAHEVKNPLTGIKGAAELLAAMFPGDNRAQVYCRLILDGVNRIAGLVEQVLAVSNPQRLKREPVNIHQVLHQALRMAGLYPQQAHPGLTVEQRFDPSLPEVNGDAAALERVFLNLVRNALEAIEATDSRLTVGMPAVTHTIRLRTAMETDFRLSAHGRRRQFLRVEVSDSGKGMKPDEVKQLFTPFFTTKPSGTGLGLVLSQRIVALHGGKLWAELGGAEADTAGVHAASSGTRDVDDADATQNHRETIPSRRLSGGGNAGTRGTHGMTFCVMLPVGAD